MNPKASFRVNSSRFCKKKSQAKWQKLGQEERKASVDGTPQIRHKYRLPLILFADVKMLAMFIQV